MICSGSVTNLALGTFVTAAVGLCITTAAPVSAPGFLGEGLVLLDHFLAGVGLGTGGYSYITNLI